MLTRRAFHLSLAALAATTAFAPRTGAATPPADDVLLNRLTFGATPDSRAAVAAQGRTAWVQAQLAMPARDPALDAYLAAARLRIVYDAGDDGEGRHWPATDQLRPLTTLNSAPSSRVALLDFTTGMEYGERIRPAQEVRVAALIRAVHAPAQLREVMTQFWHDHFNVNALKSEMTAAFFPDYDAMLRRHALGNFRALLGDVARAPAMLYYLNNEDSRASPANENFARELLELHTLGAMNYINDTAPGWRDVPGAADGLAQAYIDQDVYEVARCFTGWTVGDGRWLAEGATAPKTGQFLYVEAWHDPYQKRVLGVEFPPNRAAMADGDQVLDLLASHPGTARFVSRKLIRRLLTDDPPAALVDKITALFLHTTTAPDQIAQLIRAIVDDPAFDATPPAKIRRPFEFLAALYRATGAMVQSPENTHDDPLQRAGWRQHSYAPPTGHPDTTARWTSATTLNKLVDLALYGHEAWFATVSTRLGDATPAAATTLHQMAAHWNARFFGPAAALPDLDALQDLLGGVDAHTPLTLTTAERDGLASAIVAFAALQPHFLLR